MRRLLHIVALLYPAEWRQRYGAEFDALLDDVRPGWAAVWDVLQGGMTMQVKRSRVVLSIAGFGAAGALAAGVVAAVTPDRFASSARFRLEHAPTVSERGRLELDRPAIIHTALSRANLARIVERHDLYREERASGRLGLDEAAERLRHDISLLAQRDSSVFQVSYWHLDPATAQRVAQGLMTQLVQQDASKASVQVIDPPERPRVPASPNRPAMAGIGFGGGALLGALVALVFGRVTRRAG